MNNTSGFPYVPNQDGVVPDYPGKNNFANGPWRDTQIWEMSTNDPGDGKRPFRLPFAVDLSGANPAAGQPTGLAQDYYVTRAAFFSTYPASQRVDDANSYAPLNTRVIQPTAGSYERWYVANIGNPQPVAAGFGGDANNPPTVPDMHPFHMHLVNFVVTNRWRVDPVTGAFVATSRKNDFDGVCRHDTARVQSNELLELLVYFPPGYTGAYPVPLSHRRA